MGVSEKLQTFHFGVEYPFKMYKTDPNTLVHGFTKSTASGGKSSDF